jgi:uncharacterized protein
MSLLFDPENLSAILFALVIGFLTTAFLLFRKQRPAGVSELYIYPVKSCGSIRVNEAVATDHGFVNDRIAQISDPAGKYCTPREKKFEKLFHVAQALVNGKLILSSPDAGSSFEVDLANSKTEPTVAVSMTGQKVTLQDYGDAVSSWLTKAIGVQGCRLTGMGDKYTRTVELNPDQNEPVPATSAPVNLGDEAPYHLTSTSSLADLNNHLRARGKSSIDMQRFRPNIVVSGLKPWEEDSLKRVRIGAVEFHVWQRCGRCVMTTIDRNTLTRGPEPLATLSTFRERAGQRNFGMHLIPVTPIQDGSNIIRVGDKLEILEYDDQRREEWEKLFE